MNLFEKYEEYNRKQYRKLLGFDDDVIKKDLPFFNENRLMDYKSFYFGLVGLSVLIFIYFCLAPIMVLTEGFHFWVILLVVFGFGSTVYVLKYALNSKKRFDRFFTYLYEMKAEGEASIDQLSNVTGLSTEETSKDIQYMITKRWFKDAYYDKDINVVFLLLENYKNKKDEIDAIKKSNIASVDKELEDAMKGYEEYKMWFLNQGESVAKYNGDLSEELETICDVLEQIIEYMKSHDELDVSLKKVLKIYLPSLKNMIQFYIDSMEGEIDSETVRRTQQEITSTMEQIKNSLKNILKELYEKSTLDVNADIAILKYKMKQDGLLDIKDDDN